MPASAPKSKCAGARQLPENTCWPMHRILLPFGSRRSDMDDQIARAVQGGALPGADELRCDRVLARVERDQVIYRTFQLKFSSSR